jgi:hypothetical protein
MRTYRTALTVLAVADSGWRCLSLATARAGRALHRKDRRGLESARFAFRTVDIVIAQWSTNVEHRMLERALLERGWVEFLDQLCTFGRLVRS